MLQFVNEQEALYGAISVHSFCAAVAAEMEIVGCVLNLISLFQRLNIRGLFRPLISHPQSKFPIAHTPGMHA